MQIYGSLNKLKLDNEFCNNCGSCLEVAGDRLEVRNNKVYFKIATVVQQAEADELDDVCPVDCFSIVDYYLPPD